MNSFEVDKKAFPNIISNSKYFLRRKKKEKRKGKENKQKKAPLPME